MKFQLLVVVVALLIAGITAQADVQDQNRVDFRAVMKDTVLLHKMFARGRTCTLRETPITISTAPIEEMEAAFKSNEALKGLQIKTKENLLIPASDVLASYLELHALFNSYFACRVSFKDIAKKVQILNAVSKLGKKPTGNPSPSATASAPAPVKKPSLVEESEEEQVKIVYDCYYYMQNGRSFAFSNPKDKKDWVPVYFSCGNTPPEKLLDPLEFVVPKTVRFVDWSVYKHPHAYIMKDLYVQNYNLYGGRWSNFDDYAKAVIDNIPEALKAITDNKLCVKDGDNAQSFCAVKLGVSIMGNLAMEAARVVSKAANIPLVGTAVGLIPVAGEFINIGLRANDIMVALADIKNDIDIISKDLALSPEDKEVAKMIAEMICKKDVVVNGIRMIPVVGTVVGIAKGAFNAVKRIYRWFTADQRKEYKTSEKSRISDHCESLIGEASLCDFGAAMSKDGKERQERVAGLFSAQLVALSTNLAARKASEETALRKLKASGDVPLPAISNTPSSPSAPSASQVRKLFMQAKESKKQHILSETA